MKAKQRILLKLTGNVFINKITAKPDPALINSLIGQIKELSQDYQFGIVIGGGNIFRGGQQGRSLELSQWAAHTCGMLATLVNGVALRDLFAQAHIPVVLVSALPCSEVADDISQQAIEQHLCDGSCIIFAGGTGNPHFTTDTNAVLRALEINASEVWKGTSVPGVYEEDPLLNPEAQLLKNVSYADALEKKLGIMDITAFTLAQEHDLKIRVFDIFEHGSLISIARNLQYGTVIQR